VAEVECWTLAEHWDNPWADSVQSACNQLGVTLPLGRQSMLKRSTKTWKWSARERLFYPSEEGLLMWLQRSRLRSIAQIWIQHWERQTESPSSKGG